MIIYTIGHSTRSIEEFLEILNSFRINTLVDVRTIPKSRRNPQFGMDELEPSLTSNKIEYIHLAELGGLRKPNKDSINDAWRNDSFRGYADYMQTDEFAQGIDRLINLAGESNTVIMCAEAVPWRCHRSLIGDALLTRNVEVKDIFSLNSVKDHSFTSFAKVDDTTITYPKLVEI